MVRGKRLKSRKGATRARFITRALFFSVSFHQTFSFSCLMNYWCSFHYVTVAQPVFYNYSVEEIGNVSSFPVSSLAKWNRSKKELQQMNLTLASIGVTNQLGHSAGFWFIQQFVSIQSHAMEKTTSDAAMSDLQSIAKHDIILVTGHNRYWIIRA